MKIKIAPIRFGLLLFALFFLLLIAHSAVVFWGDSLGLVSSDFLYKLFNLDEEKNIPTAYSSALMLFSAGLFFFISSNRREVKKEYLRWNLLSILFVFLAADEFLQFHERVTKLLRSYYNFEGILYFAWVIPYAIATVLIFIFFFRFIVNLPSKTKILLIISGFLFVTGALGFELLAAKIFSDTGGIKTFFFKIDSTIEETLEFSGLILLIYSLLDFIRFKLKIPWIQFSFDGFEYEIGERTQKYNLMEISRKRISSGGKLIFLAIFFAVLIIAVFQTAGSIYDIPFKDFSRDILQTFNSDFYIGAFSQLGLIFWTSSAAVLLFTSIVIRSGNNKTMFNFLFYFGILTLVLLADEGFLLHEQVFRFYLNMPEKITQLLYIISAAAIFYFNRKSLLKTNLPILSAALVFIILSIIADKNSDLLGTAGHIFEDGLKFTGILLWFTYSLETCYTLLMPNSSISNKSSKN